MGWEGRQTAPTAAKLPRPKGQQPWVTPVAMAEQQSFAWEPWEPLLFLLGTAGFLAQAGEKEICLNKPKQTKPIKLLFSRSLLPNTKGQPCPAGVAVKS